MIEVKKKRFRAFRGEMFAVPALKRAFSVSGNFLSLCDGFFPKTQPDFGHSYVKTKSCNCKHQVYTYLRFAETVWPHIQGRLGRVFCSANRGRSALPPFAGDEWDFSRSSILFQGCSKRRGPNKLFSQTILRGWVSPAHPRNICPLRVGTPSFSLNRAPPHCQCQMAGVP